MREQKGITLIALSITIVVMLILASITIYYSKDLINNAKIQDLSTNMLLIQAKAKECVEEANFQKVDIDKADDILLGTKLIGSVAEEPAIKTGKIDMEKENYYYYLPEDVLTNMGLKNISPEECGYFVVLYDIANIKVEVINTNGYDGMYTLTEITGLSTDE